MANFKVILIEVASTMSPHSLFDAINDLNVIGSIVYIVTNNPIISAYLISVLGNMNQAIIVNGCVVKSFNANYQVGKYAGQAQWIYDSRISL